MDQSSQPANPPMLPSITEPPVGHALRRHSDWRRAAVLVTYLALLAAGAWLIGAARSSGLDPARAGERRLIGSLTVVLTLALAPIALLMAGRRRETAEARLTMKIDALTNAIRLLSDQSSLSAEARRVLNRNADRDLLFRAIEEDIDAEEWDAALVLCGELANRFGYRAEAEEFRSRIEAARAEVQDRKVADAIARLDGLIVQRRWDNALREAARIGRLFPDSPRVERLRERVEQARKVYKADLERRFLDAAGQDRIDEALGLLKELDAYLTEPEAGPYREVARGVIGKAKENLGAQFKIAVRDRQWATAAAIGRRIVNEFPNTRMASEVREMLDGILARANTPAEV